MKAMLLAGLFAAGGFLASSWGGEYSVTLQENPTTGYLWSYEMEPAGGVQETGRSFEGRGRAGECGAGGMRTFTFESTDWRGDVTLRFREGRPWEEGRWSRERTVHLVVEGAGEIREAE